MVDASIETIQPKLKAHVLIHDVVGGLGVLEIPGKYVLLLTADETRLCKSFNGSRNFTEILSDASSSGDVMSVRSLLSLVTRLVNAGALETEENQHLTRAKFRRTFRSENAPTQIIRRGFIWTTARLRKQCRSSYPGKVVGGSNTLDGRSSNHTVDRR